MASELEEYKGHHIELRANDNQLLSADSKHEEVLELLIDNQSVRYGRLPNGAYALHEYAYDWSGDLMDLAKKFIDYRDKTDKIRHESNTSEEK